MESCCDLLFYLYPKNRDWCTAGTHQRIWGKQMKDAGRKGNLILLNYDVPGGLLRASHTLLI